MTAPIVTAATLIQSGIDESDRHIEAATRYAEQHEAAAAEQRLAIEALEAVRAGLVADLERLTPGD